ncbi:hypothetical protein AX16_008548 [Volvariella volvacea WC 439]|nr:hypothetical protein AX16_008548 [Volvariella volvacea WC 439]
MQVFEALNISPSIQYVIQSRTLGLSISVTAATATLLLSLFKRRPLCSLPNSSFLQSLFKFSPRLILPSNARFLRRISNSKPCFINFANHFINLLRLNVATLKSYLPHPIRWHLDTRYRNQIQSLHLAQYWRSANEAKAYFKHSDAKARGLKCASERELPLVMYYEPALLPSYRSSPSSRKRGSPPRGRGRRGGSSDSDSSGDEGSDNDIDAVAYELPVRTFLKWHRMTFPGPDHPTLRQCTKLMKQYSNRDLREIKRISGLQSNRYVFGESYYWTPKFKRMWDDWLNRKGPDIVIVFE